MTKWPMICSFIGCLLVASSPGSPAAESELRLGVITPPPHLWTQTAAAFASDLKKATDDKLNVAVFPSGQLGNEAQMLQLLQTGAIDFAFLTASELANRLPEFSAFYTPYLAEDPDHAARILKSPVAQEILHSADRLGLIGLGLGMAGMRQIVVREPVASLQDMRGMKVRVTADVPLTDFWRFAGTAPTPIDLSILYEAFANGQIDAMHIDFENTLRLKFYDHAQTIIHSDHMMFPMVALASARRWATLSPSDQLQVRQVMNDHLDALLARYAESDRAFSEKLAALGATTLKVDASFFGDSIGQWNRKWSRQSVFVSRLKAVANQLKRQKDR